MYVVMSIFPGMRNVLLLYHKCNISSNEVVLKKLIFSEHVFIKKHIILEKGNADPGYFRSTVLDNFPELAAYANLFSLWQLRGNKTNLVPLPADIDNAKALCLQSDELNRSCVYIRPVVSIRSNIVIQSIAS
jgi:hypothetical protein